MFFYIQKNSFIIKDYSIKEPYYITLTNRFHPIICEEEEEALGILGTHTDKIYFFNQNEINLEKYDNDFNTDEILLDYTEIASDYDTGEYILYNDMDKIKSHFQEINKQKFNEWLKENSLEWSDGKNYGITLEDQSELNLTLSKYKESSMLKIEPVPKLEWHAQKEENVEWVYEDLVNLSNAISEKVYDKYHLMQKYKTEIYNTTTVKELKDMVFIYN